MKDGSRGHAVSVCHWVFGRTRLGCKDGLGSSSLKNSFILAKDFNTDTELETEQMSRYQGKSDTLWNSGKYSKGQKVTHVTWDK